MVSVNVEKCREIAKIEKNIPYNYKQTKVTGDLNDKLFFWLTHVSICHSINWEFLVGVLKKKKKEGNFSAEGLKNISNEEMYDMLKDYDKPGRIKAEKRAGLLRDLCKVLIEKYDGSALKFLEACENKLSKFYKNIKVFQAYKEDPLSKKTGALVMALFLNGVYHFKDPENFIPPIDYHITRLHIRNGSIILDENLLDKVIKQKPIILEEDTEIRKKVMESVELILKESGRNFFELDYIEWDLGRRICKRENPLCNECPLNRVCYAFNENKKFLGLLEPKFESSFY